MKKNMIALAVAGAFVAPVAMADVTISGGLQAELVHIGGNAASPNGMYAADGWEKLSAGTGNGENAGNYGFLKFAATEDLGGDLKALAVYDMNINVGDTTKAGFDTRDAYVGLSAGAYGAVLAGTLATPYKSSTASYDPFLATSFQARSNYGMSGLQDGYVSNAIAYANSFAGGMVKVVAAVVLDETQKNNFDGLTATGTAITSPSDSTVGKHAKSISVNIDPISNLDIAVAWIDVTNFGNANVDVPGQSKSNQSATKIGAKYTISSFTIAGQVEMLNSGLTVSGEKGNIAYLTGTFKFDDANGISLSVGQADKKVYSTATETLLGTDGAARYMAVGFNHAFSKNTSAMVGYRVSDDKRTAGTKETAVGAGLRVNF